MASGRRENFEANANHSVPTKMEGDNKVSEVSEAERNKRADATLLSDGPLKDPAQPLRLSRLF